VQVDAVMLSRADVGSLFGYARSYFHVDLPVVSAAITLLRSFMPRKSIDELYTVLGRAKQGKTERYFALQRHLDKSIDSFVHAPGERGLVMIVFTLPSHDLVFKVIRDNFGAPKTSTRADVIDRYRFVFRHDRAGRLVDAQEFKRLRLPRARFMPGLVDELLSDAKRELPYRGRGPDRRALLHRAPPAAAEFISARGRTRRRRIRHHRLRQCPARTGGEQCVSRRSAAQEFRRDQSPAGDLLRLRRNLPHPTACSATSPNRATKRRKPAASPGSTTARAMCFPSNGCRFCPFPDSSKKYSSNTMPRYSQPPGGGLNRRTRPKHTASCCRRGEKARRHECSSMFSKTRFGSCRELSCQLHEALEIVCDRIALTHTQKNLLRNAPLAQLTADTYDSLDAVQEWYRKTLVNASESDLTHDPSYKAYTELSGIKLSRDLDYVDIYKSAPQATTSVRLVKCSPAT
jgi:hypothetical protein